MKSNLVFGGFVVMGVICFMSVKCTGHKEAGMESGHDPDVVSDPDSPSYGAAFGTVTEGHLIDTDIKDNSMEVRM
jgi:hypothetical protein